MHNLSITSHIDEKTWPSVVTLIAQAIPNAIVAKLGCKFGILYYRSIVNHAGSCLYITQDENKNVSGVVIGSVNSEKARSAATRNQKFPLLIAANCRILHPDVIVWLLRGIVSKLTRILNRNAKEHQNEINDTLPTNAELIAIAVTDNAKGTGIAQQLIEKMEDFMVSDRKTDAYLIYTEKNNHRANRFYTKIGAKLLHTNLHHGREINVYCKYLSQPDQTMHE
jgi:ribosomal protein S18 acetylase RimI-like enzyme